MGSITWEGKIIRTPVYLSNYDDSKYLSEFSEINFIAMGGFGIVAKCKNNLDNKEYAVKKISFKHAGLSFEKLLREVEVLSSMKHPNIVRYYQAWIEPEMSGCFSGPPDDHGFAKKLSKENIESPCLYILMELCSSCLRELFKTTLDALEGQEACKMFIQISKGLGHIHEQGFVHGDLSPFNIFVDGDGIVKIGDFGLARKTEEEGYLCSDSNGILTYKAPEKVRGHMVDSKIDMYSLGMIFLEILHPFGEGPERVATVEELQMYGIPMEWADCFTGMIERLISVDPTERPSVAEVLGELENIYKTF